MNWKDSVAPVYRQLALSERRVSRRSHVYRPGLRYLELSNQSRHGSLSHDHTMGIVRADRAEACGKMTYFSFRKVVFEQNAGQATNLWCPLLFKPLHYFKMLSGTRVFGYFFGFRVFFRVSGIFRVYPSGITRGYGYFPGLATSYIPNPNVSGTGITRPHH